MKWLIFQLHWLLGITLGLVLVLMGVSGAMMAFEDEIMDALSHGVVDVAPRAAPALTPDQLLERFLEQKPGATPTRLTLQPQPGGSARIIYRPRAGERGGAHGTDRLYLDPYTGRILGKAKGETFFENVRLFHRYLLVPGEAKGVGRHITGAAAFSLIFFALSGLYLRWPRRALDWKAWLKPDLSRRGRNLYWSLHSVIGTWCLAIYLVMAVTGLTWAYPWYENATTVLLTGRPPAEDPPAPKAAKGKAPAPPPRLDLAWRTFQQLEPAGATQVIIPIPASASAPVRLRYLYPDAPHYRAVNEMVVDGRTGQVIRSTHYATDPLGQQIVAGMLAIHRGSAFGRPGSVVFMLAALTMPLFPVTGWLLYLDRRRKKAEARALASRTGTVTGADAVLIAYASQTGVAERLAWLSAQALAEGGRAAVVKPLGALGADDLRHARTLIVVASTYGAGEPPDPARAFARKHMAAPLELTGLKYGVLALGHSDYPDFCGFGRSVDRWLADSGAEPLFPRVEVDAQDEAATLAAWRDRLQELGGARSAADWAPPPPTPWVLVERRLLNPGSPGAEAYHLALEPRDAAQLSWTAGDIAEISPRHSDAVVSALLQTRALDGCATVSFEGAEMFLHEALSRSHLPEPGEHLGLNEAALAGRLRPLPKREYSIASIPADGRLELLVRKTTLPDGRLGLGSGWLTTHVSLGGDVDLRIRPNPGFHPRSASGPMLLVGAGTGMAGLRAHVRHRRLRGDRGAWLLFGERSPDADRLYGHEVDAWLSEGALARCDWAFSRAAHRQYVQDLVTRHGACLRGEVLERGAAIYVCGGVDMAAGVHEALLSVLGEPTLEALVAEGRYQRDVY